MDLYKSQESKIQTLEIKCLRAVKGITGIDKIWNQKRKEDLKVESIFEYMDTQKIKWFEHIGRIRKLKGCCQQKQQIIEQEEDGR